MTENSMKNVAGAIAADVETARAAMEQIAVAEVLQDVAKAEKGKRNVFGLDVRTEDDFKRMGRWLGLIRDEKKRLEERRKDVVGPIYAVWKAANAFLGRPGVILDEADAEANRRMDVFEREQKRLAQEREVKVRAIQATEAERIKADAAKEAEAAEKKGDMELAREIRDNVQLPIPVVVMPKAPPKIEGIRRSETWVAVVEDVGLLPEEYVERVPRMKLLNALAKERQGRNPPTGVRFEQEVIRGKVRS